jgi:uncharacterized protein YlxW (UPF0749 family)
VTDQTPVPPAAAPVRAARTPARWTLAAVSALLGVLVVGQLNGQAGVPGLSNLTVTELTQLVANVTAGNDQLRDEVADLTRQEAKLVDTKSRGHTTVGELTDDLARIRAWAGLTAVTGQGIAVTVSGPIGGDGIEELLNELRNAGAEAIAVDGIRVVVGVVVAGGPGELSIENSALGDAFEIRAIGSPQILTGTLTRTGGVVAQIGATYPEARLTVTPVDSMTLAATDLDLRLIDASPRL